MGYIYGLSCTCHPEKGTRYVGQTYRSVEKRLYEHVFDSTPDRRTRERDLDYPVHRWMAKHGVQNIHATVLEEVTDDLLDDRECHWITHFGLKNLLNISEGGRVRRGWTHTDEAKSRISESGRQRLGGNRTIQDVSIVPRIREEILKGRTYSSIAEDFGIKATVVAEIADGKNYAKVNDDGVFDPSLPNRREPIRNGHSSHRKFPKELADEVYRLVVEEGHSQSFVARKFGMSPGLVTRYLKSRGYQTSPIKHSDTTREAVLLEYRENPGISFREVARRHGVSHGFVSQVVKEGLK